MDQLTNHAKNTTTPLTRYAVDLFIPAVSRNLQHLGKCGRPISTKTKAAQTSIYLGLLQRISLGYHRKLTPGVVASEIRTMYVYICPSPDNIA